MFGIVSPQPIQRLSNPARTKSAISVAICVGFLRPDGRYHSGSSLMTPKIVNVIVSAEATCANSPVACPVRIDLAHRVVIAAPRRAVRQRCARRPAGATRARTPWRAVRDAAVDTTRSVMSARNVCAGGSRLREDRVHVLELSR